jgi:LuxR family maltose regulon positive regulatory protein
VSVAQGDASAALAALESLRQEAEAKGWVDEQLRVLVLQASALYAHGQEEEAVQTPREALALAEPGGFVRTFVDEGPPMAGRPCAPPGWNRSRTRLRIAHNYY